MKQKPTLILLSLLLLVSGVYGQLSNVVLYDFRDGTIINNGQSDDGLLTLSGNFGYHSSDYGLNMKVDGEINITVSGSSTIRFLGSQYSGLNMVGTAVEEGDLGTQDTKVVNDRSDVFDFVYSGDGATLNFKLISGTGNDLYLPTIEVIPAQAGAEAQMAEKNIVYYYDLRDESIIPASTDGVTPIDTGLFQLIVGPSNAYGYNGTQHGSVLKTGNQIILQVAGNSTIKVGGSIYSNGTISVSSESGAFDIPSQSSTTSGNFGNDGSTVDFLYVGEAGTVTLDFTGTNYVPFIEIVPVPYEVDLTPYVQKSGTITLNDIDISLTSGEDAGSDATITVSEGTVISATNELASILIDLGGQELSSYTPAFTGDIDTVTVSGYSLIVTYADATSNPTSYVISVQDNSVVVEAEPGKTYTYNFYDGSVLPQTSYQELRYTTFVTQDGILTMNSNTEDEAGQYGFHDATHGGVFFPGNSFEMIVAGNAHITFFVDTYGRAEGATLEFKDSEGNVLGSIAGENIGGADGFPSSFAYQGPKGTLTATLISEEFPTAEIYIHGLSIENEPEIAPSNGKIDVWDFGAEQLDAELYNNHLNEDIINAWYDPSITVGSAGNVLPSFSVGVLSWFGGGNDRLRSTNTNLTRYDENISTAPGYTGRIYVNSRANPGRFLSITLSEDDEVTVITKTDDGGIINFEYVTDPEVQTDIKPITSDLTELKFVAKQAGSYRLFDTQGKPSYYRVYRQDAVYSEVSGAVDLTLADGISDDFSIIFTNEAGKAWSTNVAEGTYSVDLPKGYTYDLSLGNANGYIISEGNTIEVADSAVTHDLTIIKVELYTVSGNVSGLGEELANLMLRYTPDAAAERIYVPEPVVNVEAGTYSVELEPNVEYTISAEGVNDYFIPVNTLTIAQEDTSSDVVFELKPRYEVAIDAQGLTSEQVEDLTLTFTNLYEEGYAYHFTSVSEILLRDGTYTIAQGGLDDYPVELGLTSNLTVNGENTTKTLVFTPVTNWPFDDREILSGEPSYKGLLFTGAISNEVAKGHLVGQADATIQVPVNPGEKVTVSYYYTADFSIEGGEAITTSSQSTSIVENIDYEYTGDTTGYVTISIGSSTSTTYITNIRTSQALAYTPVLRVGPDKDFLTINGALEAVRNMTREEDARVTIMIDPGNYEEMLVIDIPNITLKNASANPSIDLLNSGVDIAEGAVRVTSYYGHGYHYYSMKDDQSWDAEVLSVNKENGFYSYENKGAGTTNGSYWNSTVVVYADGFQAEYIIFENSFNQYISQKESEDILVTWASGSPGDRPTDAGNTSVQLRSFKERACAIAFANGADKGILNKCRVVGRQDSFFGGTECRVVVYKGAAMGSVDYIFGGMSAVFYKTELVMNTDDDNNDRTYITAAQQAEGVRGFLFYDCTVTSTTPGIETASQYKSKPGYFGRPWQATTSEAVFYNTTIEASEFPGYEGKSLIEPIGWLNTLGGESSGMYEYGTVELSGEDNLASRAGWSTLLDAPTLNDGTEITAFNFTKGDDGWDPLPDLIANDVTGTRNQQPLTAVEVRAFDDQVFITNVQSETNIQVYSINGRLLKTFETFTDTDFHLRPGFWVIYVEAEDGVKAVKVITH